MKHASVVASVLGALGLWWAAARANGEWMLPLDDAYIHLAMARNLVEHGVWGLTPSEFASATSSPLFTTLLAGGIAAVGPHLWLPMVLNVGFVAALAHLCERRGTPAAWLALLAVPTPYLAALGMEHVLHALLVLLLVAASLAGHRAAPVLAALACLARYESIFAVAALAVVALGERRPGRATALVAFGGGALGLYGLWCMSNGALPIPNSIVMKSSLAGGWSSQWQQNLAEGGPVLLLAGASIGRATLDPSSRREVTAYVITALLHLTLARCGWLFRYESWLLVWGCTLSAPGLALLPSTLRPLAGAVLGLPLAFRAWSAFAVFVPASIALHEGDMALARATAGIPGLRLAVHDIGVVTWVQGGDILDLAGLGTTEVARLHLHRQLSAERFDTLIEERGVSLVYVDRGWMSEIPAGLTEIGTLEYEAPGAWAKTRIFATARTDLAAVRARLAPLATDSPRHRLAWSGTAEVRPAAFTLSGPSVVWEDQTLAFYGAGEAILSPDRTGTLRLELRGTAAFGSQPHLEVEVSGTTRTFEASADGAPIEVGPVTTNSPVILRFRDDATDPEGGDRNLWLSEIRVVP